eukprot:2656927-Pleurochrysis_carterae.AAC.2
MVIAASSSQALKPTFADTLLHLFDVLLPFALQVAVDNIAASLVAGGVRDTPHASSKRNLQCPFAHREPAYTALVFPHKQLAPS